MKSEIAYRPKSTGLYTLQICKRRTIWMGRKHTRYYWHFQDWSMLWRLILVIIFELQSVKRLHDSFFSMNSFPPPLRLQSVSFYFLQFLGNHQCLYFYFWFVYAFFFIAFSYLQEKHVSKSIIWIIRMDGERKIETSEYHDIVVDF